MFNIDGMTRKSLSGSRERSLQSNTGEFYVELLISNQKRYMTTTFCRISNFVHKKRKSQYAKLLTDSPKYLVGILGTKLRKK